MKNENKSGRNKTQETIDAECNNSPATDQCPSNPCTGTGPSWSTSPFYIVGMTFYGVGYFFWSVWISSPGHDPSQHLVHLLSGRAWDTQKSLIWGKHCSITTNIILILNPKHGPVVMKKIEAIPAGTRAASIPYSIQFTSCQAPHQPLYHHLSCPFRYTLTFPNLWTNL